MKKKIVVALLVLVVLVFLECIPKLDAREKIKMIRGPNNEVFFVVVENDIDDKIDSVLTRFVVFFDFFYDSSTEKKSDAKGKNKKNIPKKRKNNRHKRKK